MQELMYFIENLYKITGIPVRLLNSSSEITLFRYGYRAENDPVDFLPMKERISEKLKNNARPFVETEDVIATYACLRDRLDVIVVFGPVSFEKLTPEQMSAYAQGHGIPDESFFIKKRTMSELCSVVRILYTARFGEMLTEIDYQPIDVKFRQQTIEEEYQTYFMDIAENDTHRISYERELMYLQNIRDGIGVKPAERTAEGVILAETQIGKMAKNPLKHYEYMTCTALALCSRAAIESGVDPASSYAMSDLFLQRLEKARSIPEMISLTLEVQNSYAKQVRLLKEQRSKSSYVEQCKSYIGQNLNKFFTPEDIADEIGINKAHLSRLFKAVSGMSIMDFTRIARVEAAKNMLKYSDESIAAIAQYLCFSSHSHFGKVFKDLTGTTPQAYRDAEQIIELRGK